MKAKTKIFSSFFFLLLVISVFVTSTYSQPSLDNFRWVGTTGLALCGQPSPSDWQTLASWGINATVNLCQIPDLGSDWSDDEAYLNSSGIEYYWLPVTDDINIAWDVSEEQVNDAIDWINQKLSEGKKVLVHCSWGQGRTPTMLAMWYVHEGYTANEALDWIKQYPEVYLVDTQKQAVVDYYNWFNQIPKTSNEDLLFIALILTLFTFFLVFLVYTLKVKKKWKS